MVALLLATGSNCNIVSVWKQKFLSLSVAFVLFVFHSHSRFCLGLGWNLC